MPLGEALVRMLNERWIIFHKTMCKPYNSKTDLVQNSNMTLHLSCMLYHFQSPQDSNISTQAAMIWVVWPHFKPLTVSEQVKLVKLCIWERPKLAISDLVHKTHCDKSIEDHISQRNNG